MTIRLVSIVCACAWTGEVPTMGACPGCGADQSHRVNKARLAALRHVAQHGNVDPRAVFPMTRGWLTHPDHKLIELSAGRHRPTAAGERVIVAAQLAEHEAGLKREIIAESVARHAADPDH